MKSSKNPSLQSLSLQRVVGWILSLSAMLVAFVIWPSSKKNSPDTKPSKTNGSAPHSKQKEPAKVSGAQEVTFQPESRDESQSSPATETGFSVIGELLANNKLSHSQAARELAKIALDVTRPEAERLEAMEHGKNLGFSHLLPLSLDPSLPLPLAESYLHGLHGHDQIKDQVTGALGLLNHNDPEIRQQAQTLIGFLIGAEEDNESPDILREKANAFLNQQEEGDGEVIGQ